MYCLFCGTKYKTARQVYDCESVCNTTRITSNVLWEICLSNTLIESFRQQFPSGGTFAEVTGPEVDRAQAILLAAYLPARFKDATFDKRLDVAKTPRMKAWMAIVIPNGVEGATYEARRKLQLDDDGRAYIDHVWAPGGFIDRNTKGDK